MRLKRLRRKLARAIALIALLLIALAVGWLINETRPNPRGIAFYVRFERNVPLLQALRQLQQEKVVKNEYAMLVYALLRRAPRVVKVGTYEFKPGMDRNEILKALEISISQMVRIPQFYWIKRTAELLEAKQVCKADDYIALCNKPEEFKSVVSFELPKHSLEGFLFPDTYNFPPLFGAKRAIEKMLETFERKVWEPNGKLSADKLRRALTIASMVELEAALDEERPIVAGVIENRLRSQMPLQIDATILYALQEWRELKRSEYKSVVSDYNTYLKSGLPPGPICSPGLASIEGALNPAQHDYLYYVALPNRHHLFTSDYQQHLRNIQKRKAALKAQK